MPTVQEDRPDWGRDVSGQSVLIDFLFATVINGLTTRATFFVGDTPYLNLFALTAVNRMRITFNWFADEALTTGLGSDLVICIPGASADFNLPAAGPWVSVVVEASAYPTTVSYRLFKANTLRRPIREGADYPIILSAINQAIGAGGASTVNAFRTSPGRALVTLDTALLTWTWTLVRFNLDGSLANVSAIRNTTYSGPFVLYLPSATVQSLFTNTTAGAGNYTVTILTDLDA